MQKIWTTAAFTAALLVVLGAGRLRAETFVFPHALEYQGRLTDASGNSVPDAVHTMTFRLYSTATGGTVLWSENHPAVQSHDGLLAVSLGTITPIPMDIISQGAGYSPESLYLEIQVGSDTPLSPRTRLGETPYAAVAQRLDGDISTEPGELLIVPVAINKGLRLVASDTAAGIQQWDGNDSSTVSPAGMKLFDRWGELIYEAMDLNSSGMTFIDSLGDTTMQINGRWGELIFETGSGESATAITPNSTRIFDRWGELIYEAMELRSDGMTLTDSLGDSTMVLRSQDDGVIRTFSWKQVSGPFTFSTRDGARESGSYASYRAVADTDSSRLDILVDTGDVIMKMNKAELIEAIAKEAKLSLTNSGAHFDLKAFGYEGDISVTDNGFAINHIDSTGDTIAVWRSDNNASQIKLGTGGSIGMTARLSLDGRSSFDPNGGAIAFAASPAGCTLVVMNGIYDTTWTVDQGGNMKTDGQVSIGTPEQLATLTVAGDICATGSIGACSDARFKTNVSQLENALQLVSNMRGVSFQWNRENYLERRFQDRQQIGLIAQELLSVVPEVVTLDAAGYYSVDYGKLTPLLVEAIKEQQKTITGQSTEIREMQDELTELKALVKQLADRNADKGGTRYGVK